MDKLIKKYVSQSWLKPLQLGMKVIAVSHKNLYEGQRMEIIGLEHDQINIMDGYVMLKLQRRVDGKLTSRVRFWWLYENCALEVTEGDTE